MLVVRWPIWKEAFLFFFMFNGNASPLVLDSFLPLLSAKNGIVSPILCVNVEPERVTSAVEVLLAVFHVF